MVGKTDLLAAPVNLLQYIWLLYTHVVYMGAMLPDSDDVIQNQAQVAA